MYTQKKKRQYPLDNSGIVHMASLKPGQSNTFRLEACLSERIKPKLLQKAFHTITPRFPTLVAGIKNGFFQYKVISVTQVPKIQYDHLGFTHMTLKEIRHCAMRVLFKNKTIIVDFFHSLTDGYGAFVFLKALLAEYLKLDKGILLTRSSNIPLPEQTPTTEENEDSFQTYAGKKRIPHNSVKSYLPNLPDTSSKMQTVTAIFDAKELLQKAHQYGVKLTSFLTAVMAESMMELQLEQIQKETLKPVQIMVPVNLRKLFPSRTLRNFSLFVMARMDIENIRLSFSELVQHIDYQLKKQITRDHFSSIMATNTSLERDWFLRVLPLKIKSTALRIGYRFFGECTSSISLSNLGNLQFPKEMLPYIRHLNVFLTPRSVSSYNCCALSFNGKFSLHFSRNCEKTELEHIFFKKMNNLGCTPTILENGVPISSL